MVAYGFVCLSAWYVSRFTAISSGPLRVAATAVGASLLSGAFLLFLSRAWKAVLSRWAVAPSLLTPTAGSIIFGFGVFVYLLSLAVSYVAAASEQTRHAERRALEGRVASREAELRVLRAQIDPHFLFNSLHSISALTAANPAGAREMCLLLAEFLRESLALGAEERIPLARELALARKYLEIERVRYGDRVRLDVELEGADQALVPSLLLQPIVENAVTHGVAHMLDGGLIRVSASSRPERVAMIVENPCDPDRPRRRGGGVGLSNVRSRLQALYGGEASVNAIERD